MAALHLFAFNQRVLFSGGEEQLHHLDGTYADRGAGPEDGGHTGIEEILVVLRRDNTTGHHHDIVATQFLEFFDHLREECFVACGEGAGTKDVDIVLHGLLSGLGRGLEQGPMSTSKPMSA